MTFHVYPDPATAPLSIPGSTAAAAVPIVELTSVPSGGFSRMFVTFAATPPVLGAAPAAPARPSISLAANGGAVKTITSVDGVNPTELVTGQVYGSVFTEGNGVHRAQLFKFSTAPITWTVTFANTDPAEIRLTWVVADSEADARKAWVEVPATLDWDAILGQTLTSQDVSLTADIGNRGTGNLTLGLAPGVVGTSDFEVVSVPASIAPGTTGDLGLAFHAPATPGSVSGVAVDLATNDPQDAIAVPAHPTSPQLAATRGRVEVMLLLDASGSMGYQPDGSLVVAASDSRWAKMVNAATQFLSLLEDFSDGLGRFGVSVFPDITDPAFPPTAPSPSAAPLHAPVAISPAAISAAIGDLAVDDPPQPNGGATPIGFGIGHTMGDTAGSFGDFESSADAVAHNRRFMVLMSDGAHNSGPHPSVYWRTAEGSGCSDPGTAGAGRSFLDKNVRAITVAYGDPAVTAFEVDHDLLALIACKSGGTALDALADDAGLEVMKSFRDALVDGLALDPTIDPGGVLTSGQPSVRRTVSVLPFDQQVSFVADWVSERRGSLRIDLLTPDCDLLSSSGPARPGVSVHTGPRFVVVTVDESFLRNDADPAHPRYGEWTMVITAEDLGVITAEDLGIEGSEQYQYAVLTRSRLRLRLRPGSSGYVAGNEIGLTADLRVDGRPVRDASISVYHDRPGAGALNWLAAQPVSTDELAGAREDLGDPEATAIGVKAHALRLRGLRFDPFGQQSVLTMASAPHGGYAVTVPGNTVPGTYDFRAVAVGEVDGVAFRREQRVQVRVGVRPDPLFTLVDIGLILIDDRTATVVRVWPRDRFGNVVMIDPAVDPSIVIAVSGATPLTGVQTEHDGSYTIVVDLPPGSTPKVTVTVAGEPVVTDLTVPAPTGLHYADRLVDFTAGAEAEPGANEHADPNAVLGQPDTPVQDFLALGAGGQVTVAADQQHVLANGEDDVNVIVASGAALRSYRVQAQEPVNGTWVDLGTSEGVSASFGLQPAGLVSSAAIKVIDTSGRTREADLSVSRAPGAQLAAVGFRTVGKAPSGYFRFQLAPQSAASQQSGIAALSRSSTHMEVWWVGADGSVQGAWWTAGAPWQRYALAPSGSASPSSGIAALSRSSTHMEVWWVGADGSVQGAWWTEGAPWQRYPVVAVPLSAAPSSGIAALSRSSTHMEVWWVGADGSVQGAWWTEGAPWQRYPLVAVPLSAAPSSGIAALSRSSTHMEVWWVGADGSVQGAWWTAGAPWQRYPLVAVPLSAAPSSGIAALSRSSTHMEVWWVGADGSVQGAWWTEGAPWQRYPLVAVPLSAAPSSGIAAVSPSSTHMEVWWVGADGSVQGAWWTEGAPWQRYPLVAVPLSAAPSSGIAALSRSSTHMEVWWVGADGSVQGAGWNERTITRLLKFLQGLPEGGHP